MYLGLHTWGVREKGSPTRAVSLRGPRLCMPRIPGVGAGAPELLGTPLRRQQDGAGSQTDRPISEPDPLAGHSELDLSRDAGR